MIPTRTPQSRYLRAVRRRRIAQTATLAAVLAVPAACGNDDAEVFQSAETTIPAETTGSDAAAPTTATEAVAPTADTELATTVAETAAPETQAPTTEITTTTGAATFPAGAEMQVSFTYSPSETDGRVNNPYVAVWVEDLDGSLVSTISLWYLQDQKGTKWLPDLPQWYAASNQASDVSMSGATRSAGSYDLVWDGTDAEGTPVAAGDYVLYVEAAREHGPHSVTSATITISDAGFAIDLPSDGELSALSAIL